MVHQADATRLYYHTLKTWPGDPPVMDCSNVATGSSFGVLGPVKKTKTSVKRFCLRGGSRGGVRTGLQSPSGQCILVISLTLTYK